MEIFNDSGGVSIVDSPEIIQNGNSSPDGLSSTESRNTELPDYAAVADVTDNEVEFMLEVKRYDDRPILIGVSPIDTIAFLKKKIHRVQLDVAPENQLIRDQTGRFLANGQGIWLAGETGSYLFYCYCYGSFIVISIIYVIYHVCIPVLIFLLPIT
eukprot:m.22781 g.22781  ORF g.22781 m.22781 type:complete len:156 (-) comp7437_c0_seq2:1057-1524(-)